MKPLKRGKTMKSRRRLIYPVLRQQVFDRDRGLCALCGGPVRWDDYECHHRLMKSQLGRDEMANLICLHGGYSITSCHAKIHAHPRASYRQGFLVPSYASPDSWPVLRFSAYWEQPGDVWTPSAPAEGQQEIPDFEEGA